MKKRHERWDGWRRVGGAGGLALLAAAVTGCARPARPIQATDGLPTARVESGPLDITVRAAGEIRASKSSAIIPKIKRQALIEFIVPEGDRVTMDQVVARLNSQDLEKDIRDIEAKLDDQQTKLDGAQTALEIQKLDNDKNLKTAGQDLAAARMELAKLLQGDAPLDLRGAELKVQTSERERSMKEKRMRETEALLADGFVTEYQVEEDRIDLEKAKVAAETAKVELKLLNEFTTPLQRTKAENTVAEAETDLEKTRKSSAALLRQKTQEVETAQRTVEQTRSDLADRRQQLEAYIVKAPTDGVVTYASAEQSWRRGDVQVGANTAPGQVLVTIPDMSAMVAAVNVSEADIHGIAKNQTATLTVEAASGRAFAGTVKKVAEVANAGGWWGTDVKEFQVEIEIQDAIGLKPGFSCDAVIQAKRIERALSVPIAAVFRKDDQYRVYRVEKGAARPVTVRIGESTDTRVRILSGLNVNDTVLLTEPPQEQGGA